MSSTTTTNKYDSSLSNHDAEVYRTNANFVYSQAAVGPILASLDAKEGEKIIDLGCGSGELTKYLSEVVGPKGAVVGIDSSADMLEKAAIVTSSSTNVTYMPPTDIQSIPSPPPSPLEPESFDAVFSNATLHWCRRDPLGVLTGIKQLLKPDGKGRFVAEMGGHMNMIGVRGAIWAALRRRGVDPNELDPWYFPRPAEYSELLVKAGFKPISLELVPRPTPLPTDLQGWLTTFARSSFLSTFSDEEAQAICDEVVAECEIDTKDWQGKWEVMYVRLRIVAST